jgi:hypothetical protein
MRSKSAVAMRCVSKHEAARLFETHRTIGKCRLFNAPQDEAERRRALSLARLQLLLDIET